jgi:uncharacterized membrane protein
VEVIMPAPQTRNPVATAKIMGHPLHPLLVTLPIGFFVATLLFDLIYWSGREPAFATGALWLLGAGLFGAVLAAIAGVIDFTGDPRIRGLSGAWPHAIGNVIAVLIQAFSFFQRSQDAAGAVLPLGLILSIVAIAIFGVTGWLGGELVFRGRVAVQDEPRR